ncbi:MAG: cytochrome c biogenesis protein [Armatimonadota bacterium]|nr:cytochrome c biogenesis protein [Armatimonadota bacterium]
MTRILIILAALAATVLYAITPPAAGFAKPESTRILLFHVPEAMLCGFFFLWGAIMAARHLLSQRSGAAKGGFDRRSLAAIEMGTILCVLATLTGMVFAYEQWGVAWDWDPRQTTIFVQLLIYAAYFALRTAFSSPGRARAAAAAYAVFAFMTVPFLIWVLPRLLPSKHSGANQAVVGGGLDTTYRTYFTICLIVIGAVAVWCYTLRVRQADREAQLDHERDSSDSPDSGVVRPVRLRGVD